MITERQPTTWRELQEWTSQILTECGWDSRTEITVPTVRGQVELDVLALEVVEGREYRTAVECKFWSERVPQHVVHSFRTVVADIGVNSGYIVSKAGFQAGAFQAADKTNIRLLTWEEFQDVFEEQWYFSYFIEEVTKRFDDLTSYLEPIPAMAHWDEYLSHEDVVKLKDMFEKYFWLGALLLAWHPAVAKYFGRNRIRLPLGSPEGDTHGVCPVALKTCVGYREFIGELEKLCTPLLAEFRSFHDKAMKRKAEGA